MRVQSIVSGFFVACAVAAMTLLAGCAGSEATPSGECGTDADCQANETCDNGTCVLKGMACNNNMDCPPGFMCTGGICTSASITDGDETDTADPDSEPADEDKDSGDSTVDGDDDPVAETEAEPEADPEMFEPEPDPAEETVTEEETPADGDVTEAEAEIEPEAEIDGDAEETVEQTDDIVEAEEETAAEQEPDPEPEAVDETEAESDVVIDCGEVDYRGVCIDNVLYYCISGEVRVDDCEAAGRICEFWTQAGINACLGGDGATCGNEGDPVCADGYACQGGTCQFVGDCSPGAETCTDGDAYACGDDHYWHLKETCADGSVCRVENDTAVCAEPVDGDLDAVDEEPETEIVDDVDPVDDADTVDDVDVVETEPELEEGCGDVTYSGSCEGNVLVYCYEEEVQRVDCGANSMTCQDVDGTGDYWCVSNEGGACTNPPPVYCRNDLVCFQGTCDPADACNTNGWLPDGVTSGSTSNGTNQFDPSCVDTNARGNEMLYMLHINAREWVEVEVNPSGSGDPVLYYLTSCDAGACPLGVDDNGSGSSESFALGSENPAEVFVGVDKYNSGTYSYTVDVTRHAAQTCADVTTINSDRTISGSTSYQFNDYNTTVFGSCADGQSATGNGHDFVYRIVPPAGLETHITVDPDTSSDVVLFLLNACDPAVASCGYCRDYESRGYAETVVVDADTETEFYLVVDGYSEDEGFSFTMDVSFQEPDSGCAAMGRSDTDFLDMMLLWVIATCGVAVALRRRRKVHS